jgi:hypothetical protein
MPSPPNDRSKPDYEVIVVADKEKPNRQVRRATFLTVGFAAALIFGITVLASKDWIPGTVIVVASLIGLAKEVPMTRKPRPPRSRPTS